MCTIEHLESLQSEIRYLRSLNNDLQKENDCKQISYHFTVNMVSLTEKIVEIYFLIKVNVDNIYINIKWQNNNVEIPLCDMKYGDNYIFFDKDNIEYKFLFEKSSDKIDKWQEFQKILQLYVK